MVKLDATLLRYLNQEDFKVLTSVEMGMKNHELVPGTLVNSIASLRFGGCGKVLVDLTKNKLLGYERGKRYDGYRLTYAGYDYLALNVLTHREVITGVGNQIGVGKESDVYICESPNQEHYAAKFHRLGRVCFRKVSEKRDFYTKSKNKTSWIYLSRKAAQREFKFLSLMYHQGMPVPKPIESNRHVVVMELVKGQLLNHYTLDSFETETRDSQIASLYKNLMDLIFKFANEMRVIHGDFNEFNIIIRQDSKETNELIPVIIDLPQMIGVEHELAPEYFERDVSCIVGFFVKRFHYESSFVPRWEDISESSKKAIPTQMSLFLKDTLNAIKDNQSDTEDEQSDDGAQEPKESAQVSSSSKHLDVSNSTLDPCDSEVESIDENRYHELVTDIDDCLSQFTAVTIDPLDARRRLRAEMFRKETNRRKRDAAKPKNIKGDANPVRRRRKVNQQVACEDTAAFNDCF